MYDAYIYFIYFYVENTYDDEQEATGFGYWIGFTDKEIEGMFVWSDGTNVSTVIISLVIITILLLQTNLLLFWQFQRPCKIYTLQYYAILYFSVWLLFGQKIGRE